MLGTLFGQVQKWWEERCPDWAEHLGRWRFARMMDALESELRRRGFDYRRTDTALWFQKDTCRLVLPTLSRTFGDSPIASWSLLAEEAVEHSLLEGKGRRRRSKERMRFSEARDSLRVQLVAERPHGPHRYLEGGLYAAVVRQSAEGIHELSEHVASRWKRHDVFDTAIANTRRQPVVCAQVDVADKKHIGWLMLTGSPFAASNVLALEEHAGELPFGAFVAVPESGTALVRALDNRTAFITLPFFMEQAADRYAAAGTAAISVDLFWWHAGVFQRLDAEFSGTGMRFEPGERFEREVLHPLLARHER